MQIFANIDIDSRWSANAESLSGTTITPTGTANVVNVAQLSAPTTIAPPSAGTIDGNAILFRFADRNGQTTTWNAIYSFGTDVVLSDINATAAGKEFHVLVRYSVAKTKWQVESLIRGFA